MRPGRAHTRVAPGQRVRGRLSIYPVGYRTKLSHFLRAPPPVRLWRRGPAAAGQMADDEPILAAARALPLAERALHSNWKVRCEAYAAVSSASGEEGAALLREFGARGGARRARRSLTRRSARGRQGAAGRQRQRAGRGAGGVGRLPGARRRRGVRGQVRPASNADSWAPRPPAPRAARLTPGPSHGAYLASNLVAKGLAARPKTAARAAEALLLLIELDAAEAAVVRARARAHARTTPRRARARRAPPAPPPAPSRPLTRPAPRRRRA